MWGTTPAGGDGRPQRRVLVLNKVDLVEDKQQLLPLAAHYGQLPGFERTFMVSAWKGGKGVDQLRDYLKDCAPEAAWEEDPRRSTDQSVEEVALLMVREALLDKLHEELPYQVQQEHVGTQVLRDGSVRVEQRLWVLSQRQRGILVGAQGEHIRNIGIHARRKIENILRQRVHLALLVKVRRK